MNIQDVAQTNIDRGWAVVPLGANTKKPYPKAWTTRTFTAADFNLDDNLGVKLGEPSGGLVDVDLDNASARMLADQFLPPTSVIFGRKSSPRSHRLYVVPDPERTKKWPEGVELRATGGQTMFPPSRHPSGEMVTPTPGWKNPPGAVSWAVLSAACDRLAAAIKKAPSEPSDKPQEPQAAPGAVWTGPEGGQAPPTPDISAAEPAAMPTGGAPPLPDGVREQVEKEAASSGKPGQKGRVVLNRELKQLRETTSNRNNALNNAAFALGSYISAGELNEDEVRKALTEVALEIGLEENEIRPTINSGFEKGKVAPTTPPEDVVIDTANAAAAGDVRLGMEFAAAFSATCKYCENSKKWFVWNDRFWEVDATNRIVKLYGDLCIAKLAAANATPNKNAGDREGAFWISAMRKGRAEAALYFARSNEAIAVKMRDFDSDLWLLNTLSGTIYLKDGSIRPAKAEDLITKMAPVEYQPDADQKEWLSFLNDVLPDGETMEFLQMAVGYSLTGSCDEEVVMFIHGETGAGKSTFISAISTALGDYAAMSNFASFLNQKYDSGSGPRSDLVRLAGRRFVAAVETRGDAKLADGLLKKLSGKDAVTFRDMYKKDVQIQPTFTIWLIADKRPKAADDDSALWRRLRLIPFTQVPEEQWDPNIKKRLMDPTVGAAVLTWAVQGCVRWQQVGLKATTAVKEATLAWRGENNPIDRWLDERCVMDPSYTSLFKSLRENYEQWCQTVRWRPVSKKRMGKALAVRLGAGEIQRLSGSRGKAYTGIKLANVVNGGGIYPGPETGPATPGDVGQFTGDAPGV